ncbi:hypothetical protein ABZ851_29920 [Streptomyces sp. NPDC047049]|uniref:hypothetical protein n=1 Tax=Streptomyces sp. NPDC047049 TaxID=3156688 RepID=UPI0033FDB965
MAHPLFPDDEFPVDVLPYYPVDDHSGDGYHWMRELPVGWEAVGVWGSEGWDLGAWPYQVVAHYDCPLDLTYGLAHYIEGDVTVTAYGSRAARDRATDELALGTWLWEENGPREGLPATDTPAAEIPDRFRGPYRPAPQPETSH